MLSIYLDVNMNVDHTEWTNCKCNQLIALNIKRYTVKNLRTMKLSKQ